MSTMYSRRAGRLLSLDHGRRTGPQLPLDVQNGATPRHAQGWREHMASADQLDAAGDLVECLVMLGVVACVVLVGVKVAVAILG